MRKPFLWHTKMMLSFDIGIDDVMAFHSNYYDNNPTYVKHKSLGGFLRYC